MKTAVEWLLEELPKVYVEHRHLVIEQAKELEKQQIIDARVNGMCNGIDIGSNTIDYDLTSTHEQYYNETFTKASNDLNNNQNG
jgi:hypothetical protein